VSLTLSPDGKSLAAGGLESVSLFNLIVNKEVASLPGIVAPYSTLAFSADGETLASYGEDSVLRLWTAPSFKELEESETVRPGK
jgi:WD40 repeat protein